MFLVAGSDGGLCYWLYYVELRIKDSHKAIRISKS